MIVREPVLFSRELVYIYTCKHKNLQVYVRVCLCVCTLLSAYTIIF